ncbi:hypothetical protein CEXT_237701 [Caerostris extrusa]|uniref:Uncharacterized protein n=1 Tax=Caerostris extrusa TaxID=172846 RepID=A0AAV4WXF7_CAEEX|nr:hypothetical protein CEXT_237701 [Caerostris extrusa]
MGNHARRQITANIGRRVCRELLMSPDYIRQNIYPVMNCGEYDALKTGNPKKICIGLMANCLAIVSGLCYPDFRIMVS